MNKLFNGQWLVGQTYSMTNEKAIGPRVVLALGLLYLIWGSTFLSVRILLEFLPPLVITYSRNFTAGFL